MRLFPSRVRTALLPSIVAMMLLASAAVVAAAHLAPGSAVAWAAYVSATEHRIRRELAASRGFLAMDFAGDASQSRSAVLDGAVVVRKMATTDGHMRTMEVPSALVHHWRGEVMIPGITVGELVSQLQHGAPPTRQEDVLESTVLERGPDRMRVYLKLQRRKFVAVVYDTEHVVTFARHGASRATSTSVATKIVELSAPGTLQERELPIGEDRGFLWRLNAYWRYEEVAGGVIVECESISLSRDVPAVVSYVAIPLIESTARESMTRTLLALKARFALCSSCPARRSAP